MGGGGEMASKVQPGTGNGDNDEAEMCWRVITPLGKGPLLHTSIIVSTQSALLLLRSPAIPRGVQRTFIQPFWYDNSPFSLKTYHQALTSSQSLILINCHHVDLSQVFSLNRMSMCDDPTLKILGPEVPTSCWKCRGSTSCWRRAWWW